MGSKRQISFTTVGGSSILTIFAVLCFIVFALLSLSTAKADRDLSDKATAAVKSYYEADTAAEEILALLRSGGMPDSVEEKGANTYVYSCPIDDGQELQVTVHMKDEDYEILQWQKKYIGEWKADDSMEVWDGGEDGAGTGNVEITE